MNIGTDVNGVPHVKDFLGNQIEAGHLIVYPGRKGSALWMSRGVVKEIDGNTGFLSVQVESGRFVTLQHPERAVVISR